MRKGPRPKLGDAKDICAYLAGHQPKPKQKVKPSTKPPDRVLGVIDRLLGVIKAERAKIPITDIIDESKTLGE